MGDPFLIDPIQAIDFATELSRRMGGR